MPMCPPLRRDIAKDAFKGGSWHGGTRRLNNDNNNDNNNNTCLMEDTAALRRPPWLPLSRTSVSDAMIRSAESDQELPWMGLGGYSRTSLAAESSWSPLSLMKASSPLSRQRHGTGGCCCVHGVLRLLAAGGGGSSSRGADGSLCKAISRQYSDSTLSSSCPGTPAEVDQDRRLARLSELDDLSKGPVNELLGAVLATCQSSSTLASSHDGSPWEFNEDAKGVRHSFSGRSVGMIGTPRESMASPTVAKDPL
ncbi:unnamed protein product [Polarella glacialis]|uniref:Uncharacterized protein n=1 Tax=Polarella glacialis TaxID=89957 RepID=A0A813FWU7_POLGL|nr:unnamed protein product [Polarella glacialis]